MKLPAVPVTSFQDATLNAEAVQGVLTSPSKQPLAFLQLLTSGLVQVATGTQTVTFTASSSSNTATVTHGIGRTPRVWATVRGLDAGIGAYAITGSVGATTFNVAAVAGSAISTTVSIDWLAIG